MTRRSVAVVALLSPAPVVVAALIGHWPWYVALGPIALMVVISSWFAGRYIGALTGLFGSAGIALVAQAVDHPDRPGGAEPLLAMAALLMIAALFGTYRVYD